MTRNEIEQALIVVLTELQQLAGETGCKVSSHTTPMVDLGFFDSLLALETTVLLEERLGASWAEDSIFVEKGSSRAMTVAEIAQKLAA